MIGQTLGRYVIESQLGEGGMGIVYRARDTQLARTVAIKVLAPGSVADADRTRRFVREAKAASALNHPNIVTIYDFGSDGGTDFIVMEYVDGTTLDRHVPAHGLPVKRALIVAAAMADALAKAHAAGILHRDLKPANVLITSAGVAKILDFGIAKLLADPTPSAETRTAAVTEAGTLVGTPAYMSPEQAEGRPLDARSDIFSFGSLLYEMVTGRRAFGGDSSLSVVTKVVHEEPLPPRQLTPAIPADLEKAILRCLRKDPARRYQTMADLKVALDDISEDSIREPPLPAPAPRSPGRWRWAAVGLVPLVAGAVYFAVHAVRTPARPEPSSAVPLTSLSGQVQYPALSPDGNHVAFTWNGAAQDNQDVYVQQIGAGIPHRLTTDAGDDSSPAWSPDGLSIAFLRRQAKATRHEVRVVAPLGGPERKIAEVELRRSDYRPLTIAWCPDSACLIVPDAATDGRGDALVVIARDSGAKRQLTFPAGQTRDTDPAIAPDGRSLVFRRDLTPFTGELYRLPLGANLTPAGDAMRLTDTRVNGSRPAWLPNSREIVFSSRGSLWRLDAVAGGSPTRLAFVGMDGFAPAISPPRSDGRVRLVYVRASNDTNVWRVDTTAPGLPATAAPRKAITSTRADHLPALSPDGRRLAFFSSRSGEFELWVADPDGSNAVQLTSLRSLPGFPRWSPDGETLAFHSDPEGHPDVMTIPANGGPPRVLMPGPAGGGFPSFSRDGRWIYFSVVGEHGIARLRKLPATGGAAVNVTEGPGALAIESYDGRDLYYLESAPRPSALWQLPLAGGAPVKVLDEVVNIGFDVVERGIYYMDLVGGPTGKTRLRYLDFATHDTTTVVEDLGTVVWGMSASRDGRTIFFSRLDSSADELILVDDFR